MQVVVNALSTRLFIYDALCARPRKNVKAYWASIYLSCVRLLAVCVASTCI